MTPDQSLALKCLLEQLESCRDICQDNRNRVVLEFHHNDPKGNEVHQFWAGKAEGFEQSALMLKTLLTNLEIDKTT